MYVPHATTKPYVEVRNVTGQHHEGVLPLFFSVFVFEYGFSYLLNSYDVIYKFPKVFNSKLSCHMRSQSQLFSA